MTYGTSNFSERLRTARIAQGMTQDEFAIAIHGKVRSVSRWETGRANPRASAIKKITSVLKIVPIWLLRGEGPMVARVKTGSEG